MIAYKCLRRGAVGPFSGFRWPVPEPGAAAGPWVESAPSPCASGIHACRPDQLPYWLNWELWLVELDGEVTAAEHKLVAPRGRLVRAVREWTVALQDAFARACAERVLALPPATPDLDGYRRDAVRFPEVGEPPAMMALLAARAAEVAGGPGARLAERAWQAAWLEQRLPLS